jgi:hypothetical protein
MDPIVETKDDLKKVFLSLKPGERSGLHYDEYALLFPPGERDDDARRACLAFAASVGCTIEWGRIVSGFALLEQKDPLFAWRERMLDLHGGLARAEAARAAEARSG